MGVRVSKVNSNLKMVENKENQATDMSRLKGNLSHLNSPIPDASKDDEKPKAERKKSKVRFEFNESTFERNNKPASVNEDDERVSATTMYRRTVSEISVRNAANGDDDELKGENNSRPGSTATCTFLRSTSQLPGKTTEDGTTEDDVFCELTALSVDSSEYQQDGNGDSREIKTTVSHLSLTCYNDADDENVGGKAEAPYRRVMSQISVTCVQHYDSEIRTSTGSEGVESSPKERRKTTRKISQVMVTYYDAKNAKEDVEGSDKKKKKKKSKGKGKSKQRRKKTIVHLADAAVEVCRSQKEIANYCLPLPSSQFIGQTTMSLHVSYC
jgi:hypothetical protein